MEQKVRLISISGQPLSGKSTVIDEIKSKLESKGIKTEDIHVVSVGQLFRKYFNNIIDIAKKLNNPEEFEELAAKYGIDSPFIKPMAEAIKKLSKAGFDFEHYDIEQANNNEDLKEIRDIIDTIVDERTTKLGEQALKRNNPEEVWIFDSRLAFKMIPESFAVRLTVREDVAGKRLMGDTRKRGKEDNKYQNEEEATQKVIKRAQGEEARYKERYGVELSNEGNYNLIIDTSYSEVTDIADVILQCEELERKGAQYWKKWMSSKMLIPKQILRDSICRVNDMDKSIKKNGYDPSSSILVQKVDGMYRIIDGHTRTLAAAGNGLTLLPCDIIDGEGTFDYETLQLSALYDFEDAFIHGLNKKQFSYEEVYPNLYKKITEAIKKKQHESR